MPNAPQPIKRPGQARSSTRPRPPPRVRRCCAFQPGSQCRPCALTSPASARRPDPARTAPTAATGRSWPRCGASDGSTRSAPPTSRPCSITPLPPPGHDATAATAATPANTSSPPPAPSTTGPSPTALIAAGASPAHRVAKPRRLPSTRRALTPDELDQINLAARTSGNDAILDALLLRLHTETACRRGGALALRLVDLDADHGLVRLREKGETLRWQPISPALADRLADHADHRGAVATRRRAAALPRRPRPDQPPLRPPLAPPRPPTALGRRPRHLHPLAAPHHPDLGRTPLRLRHRPRLRRPHRHHRTRHHHLHQSRPARRRHRPGRHDRPTPPTHRSLSDT